MKRQGDRKIALALEKVSNSALTPAIRLKACDTLVQNGYVSAALPCLRSLVPHPKCGGRARLLQRTGEYLLRRGLVNDSDPAGADARRQGRTLVSEDTHSAFWRAKDPERASENLVIVFTGISRQFWISLDILHRILQRYAGQIVYLRDFRSFYFLAGVGNWGGYRGTLERLRQVASKASAKRLCVIGNSAGGFAALKYGLDLSADAILALSPRTHLNFLHSVEKMAKKLQRLRIPPEDLDLLPAYDQAVRYPRTTIVYGDKNERDELQAKRFAHLSGVNLIAIPGAATHSIMTNLLASGQFEVLLKRTLAQ